MTISEDSMNVTEFLIKFYTGEPCPSSVCCKKQKQFIIYKTHFIMSVYVPKSRFSAEKGVHVHCSGALLKPKTLFAIFLKRLQLT